MIIGISIVAMSTFAVLYIWCIKPHKSIAEGLKDWAEESAEDR